MTLCPKCSQDNEAINKFCDSCGARIVVEEEKPDVFSLPTKPRRRRRWLILAALGFIAVLVLTGFGVYWYIESQSSRLVEEFQYGSEQSQADQEKVDVLIENPVNPSTRRQTYSLRVEQLLSSTEKYDGKTVSLAGTIVMSKARGGKANLIYIDDGTGVLPILWLGPIAETGTTVKITGSFNKKAQAIDADSVETTGLVRDFSSTPQATIYWSTIALVTAAILTVLSEGIFFFRRWRFSRAKRALAS